VSDDSTASGPDGWPVALRGVTESIVTTLGPNDRWNVAALGPTRRTIRATRHRADVRAHPNVAELHRARGGVVQFTSDPRTFVDAALTVREVDDPVLPTADAWVEVTVEEVASETEGDTTIRTWALDPVEHAVVRERVPTINRGFSAVIDATVAASRLDVPGFDTAELLDRLRYRGRCRAVRRPAEREAFARIDEATGWRSGRGRNGGGDDEE